MTTETGKAAVAGKTTIIWKKSGKAGHWLGCLSIRTEKGGKTNTFPVMWISIVSCRNPLQLLHSVLFLWDKVISFFEWPCHSIL